MIKLCSKIKTTVLAAVLAAKQTFPTSYKFSYRTKSPDVLDMFFIVLGCPCSSQPPIKPESPRILERMCFHKIARRLIYSMSKIIEIKLVCVRKWAGEVRHSSQANAGRRYKQPIINYPILKGCCCYQSVTNGKRWRWQERLHDRRGLTRFAQLQRHPPCHSPSGSSLQRKIFTLCLCSLIPHEIIDIVLWERKYVAQFNLIQNFEKATEIFSTLNRWWK